MEFDPNAAAAHDSGLFGLNCSPEEAGVHVIPVPFEATTSYRRGTAGAPAAILPASHQVELYDTEFGNPYEAGICLLPANEKLSTWNAEACYRAEAVLARHGSAKDAETAKNVARVNELGHEVNQHVYQATRDALDRDALPIILGGDHSVPFGSIQACAEHVPALGLLHFDAHADMRKAYCGFTWSHASILYNVLDQIDGVTRIAQVGIRDLCEEEHRLIRSSEKRVHTLFDSEWAAMRRNGAGLSSLIRETLATLPEHVYVTFDIDGLDPTLCPNTGTPVPGGLNWHDALLWLSELSRSGKRVVGMDLVEVAGNKGSTTDSTHGEADSWDAIVGARLLYKMIGCALATR